MSSSFDPHQYPPPRRASVAPEPRRQSQQYYEGPRNPDYDPYAPTQPQPIPTQAPPHNPYGPTQPVVVGAPQHPGLRRESLSYQPPPNPLMAHSGAPLSSSFHGAPNEQMYGTSPARASYPSPQPQYATPPSQPAYGTSPTQPPYGSAQPQPGYSIPPSSYPQGRRQSYAPPNLHPQQPPPPRSSQEWEDAGVTFDENTYGRPHPSYRPRSYSTASHHSAHSAYGGDGRSRRSSRSSGGSGRHRHKDGSKRHYREDERPTYGDSVLLVWDSLKDLLSSKRE